MEKYPNIYPSSMPTTRTSIAHYTKALELPYNLIHPKKTIPALQKLLIRRLLLILLSVASFTITGYKGFIQALTQKT